MGSGVQFLQGLALGLDGEEGDHRADCRDHGELGEDQAEAAAGRDDAADHDGADDDAEAVPQAAEGGALGAVAGGVQLGE